MEAVVLNNLSECFFCDGFWPLGLLEGLMR